MNQTAEARHAAAGIRELIRILRRADRKIAARKPELPATYAPREVMKMLGIKSPTTLATKVATGVVPPPLKPESPPAGAEPGSAAYMYWYRQHRFWNARLMFAYVSNILPEEIRSFTCPEDWRAWLRDHHAHEEYAG